MTELDLELQRLCEKYGLSVNEARKRYDDFLNEFQKVWDQISDDEPIAFYGFTTGFYHMYSVIKCSPKNIVCIIENINPLDLDYDDNINNTPVIKVDSIDKYKFQKIILTGFTARHQMKQDIVDYDPNIEIIDIYEMLEEKGLHYDVPFVNFTNLNILYKHLESIRMSYKNSSDAQDRQKNLKKLIQTYLEFRDFVYANLYIREYISSQYSDKNLFIELQNELNQFVASIREKIKSRGNKNIFVFVMDSFSSFMVERAPFVKRLAENSFSFRNAYASGFHTRSSIFSLLAEKNYIEDGLYKIYFLESQNSNYILDMKASACKVKYISSYYFTFLSKVNNYDVLKIYGEIQPLLYWNLLLEIIDESADCVYFIHTFEVHAPFYSGYSSKPFIPYPMRGMPPQQCKYWDCVREDALKYMDQQLEFYIGLLNLDKDTIIVTADHQEVLSLKKSLGLPIPPDMYKVPLIIHSKNIAPGIYENIYSTIDLPNLLRQLIRGDEKLKITPMEYARQEIEPAYGKDLKLEATCVNLYGQVVFITNNERYAFYFNGAEQYFLLSDLETNLIGSEQYQERINYFRNQINIDTRDVWKFLFEKYPHLLEIHKDKVEEFLNENKNPNKLYSHEQ